MSLSVVDLFCGCGGISLGFSLSGFDVVFGLDNNRDAIASFAHNFPNATTLCKNIENLDDEEIPKSDIIVGGPPCVNFSSSKGSRANVLEGLKLVQLFLKFVYQRKPKYWLMENVPRIGLYLPERIPLRWIGIDEEGYLNIPTKRLFNIWEYGAPQKRTRLLIGDFPIPEPTHLLQADSGLFESKLKPNLLLGDIINAFPDPLSKLNKPSKFMKDPIYDFKMPTKLLDDHFYDTRMLETEWKSIKNAKVNHPFMGRMDFPDDTNKLSRTVVSLQMGRETIVIQQKNNFRRLTIRECASIQTFPISFKFAGKTIESRYRQAGNAVPPILSYRIANTILKNENIKKLDKPKIFVPNSLENPVPRKRKPRKINYSKSRTILFPGKEIRGFRIELTSKYMDYVTWSTIVHVGEGKSNHRILLLMKDDIDVFVNENLIAFGGNIYGIYESIIKEVNLVNFQDGDSLHKYLHESYGILPDWFSEIIAIFDKYLPKNKWSNFNLPIVFDNIKLERKQIRIRLLIALSISKIIELRLNLFNNEQIQITA